MRSTVGLTGSLVVVFAAADFLGIPTVPYESAAPGVLGLSNVKSIIVDSRYVDAVDDNGETLIPPTLYKFASVFASDLNSTLGIEAAVSNGTSGSSTSIFLTLGSRANYLDAAGLESSEGYTLDVNSSGIFVTGASPLGAWWGTRTIIQQGIISRSSNSSCGSSPSISYGSGIDTPGWRTRGMMLDAGRHYYPPDFLTELCAYMSFFKQNTLHLHLSDNLYNNHGYTAEQSLSLYARFRLYSHDKAVAGLNPHVNESYTQSDFDEMQTSCASRGVVVIPEIEAPGHALPIVQWKPELGYSSDLSLLNISHPETIPTMKTIWGVFLPWFHSKTVSIGADEYTGPAAEYNTFVNAMNEYIGVASNKSIRIWGTFPPVHDGTYVNIDQNVSVQHWAYFEDDPLRDYINNNYSVVNSNDDFYIVNKWAPPGGYLQAINLTKTFQGTPPDATSWRPNVFDQSQANKNPAADSKYVLGAIAPLWNDYGYNASVYSEAYYAWRNGIPALADKQWGGNLTAEDFATVFAALQPLVPGQNLDRAIASASQTIFNYTVSNLGKPVVSSGTGANMTTELLDSSSNGYHATTTCSLSTSPDGSAAMAMSPNCSITTPLSSKGRNYTLALSLLISSLSDPTNATLLTGRDSALMLTPNITFLAGGNYFRLNSTVPLGKWFNLRILGDGQRTFAAVDVDGRGEEEEFLAVMGINGNYHHWAEIAFEAPLATLGGGGWTGFWRGMSLTSVAERRRKHPGRDDDFL